MTTGSEASSSQAELAIELVHLTIGSGVEIDPAPTSSSTTAVLSTSPAETFIAITSDMKGLKRPLDDDIAMAGDDAEQPSTGFSTIDSLIDATPFVVVGTYSIYRAEKPENHLMEPTTSWDDVCEFIKLGTPTRLTKMYLVRYDGVAAPADHAGIFDTLLERFKTTDSAFLVGRLACGGVIAYVRNLDSRIVPDLRIDGTKSRVYLGLGGHFMFHQHCIDAVVKCLTHVRTTMRICNASADSLSWNALVAATAHLTPSGMTSLRGTLMMKDKKSRSAEDSAVLRAWTPLMDIKNLRSPPALLNFAVTRPPSWSDLVCPPSVQMMVYADLDSNTMKTVSLKDWLDGSHPAASHTLRVLLMYGDAGTGKTPVSLLIAKRLTEAYRSVGMEGRALIVSEPEALPRLNFKEGDVLCIQEYAPSLPRGCNKCMHIEDVKGLCEVPLGADLPGKGTNGSNSGIIHIGPKVVRVFTSNWTPDAWYPAIPRDVLTLSHEELCALPVSSRALLKRIVFWHVPTSLLKAASVDSHRIQEASNCGIASFFTGTEAIP